MLKNLPYNKFIVVVIAIALSAWVFSGVLFSKAENGDKQEETQVEQAFRSVVVREVNKEPYARSVFASGTSKAGQSIILRSETAANVINKPFDDGAKVNQGDIILELSDDGRKSAFESTKTKLEEAQNEFNRIQSLVKRGVSTKAELDQQSSRLSEAKSNYERAKTELDKVIIKAPFSGILNRTYVDVGDAVQPGAQLSQVIDLNELIVEATVSERQIFDIKLNQKVTATFFADKSLEGKLTYISKSANESTRTYPIEATFDNSQNELPSGMTVELDIATDEEMVIRVPRSVLTLNQEGVLGVKRVNSDNVVEFVSIDIKADDPSLLVVEGLNEGDKIIVRGQDFVSDGEQVEAVNENDLTKNSNNSAPQENTPEENTTKESTPQENSNQEKNPEKSEPETGDKNSENNQNQEEPK